MLSIAFDGFDEKSVFFFSKASKNQLEEQFITFPSISRNLFSSFFDFGQGLRRFWLISGPQGGI